MLAEEKSDDDTFGEKQSRTQERLRTLLSAGGYGTADDVADKIAPVSPPNHSELGASAVDAVAQEATLLANVRRQQCQHTAASSPSASTSGDESDSLRDF